MLYDEVKNRVYFTVHGFWKNIECIPDFIPDWKKILTLVKPGFTILTNLSTMITHPKEVSKVHEDAHKLLSEAGVKKVARIMPADKIAYLQVLSMHENVYLPSKSFNSEGEADQWLDIMTTPSDN